MSTQKIERSESILREGLASFSTEELLLELKNRKTDMALAQIRTASVMIKEEGSEDWELTIKNIGVVYGINEYGDLEDINTATAEQLADVSNYYFSFYIIKPNGKWYCYYYDFDNTGYITEDPEHELDHHDIMGRFIPEGFAESMENSYEYYGAKTIGEALAKLQQAGLSRVLTIETFQAEQLQGR